MSNSGLNIALKIAANNDNPQWNLGAVIKKSGRVLAIGWNKDKNDPKNAPYETCSVHAEVDALRQVDDASGSVLYVARVTRGGNIGMARPCERCWEVVLEAEVKRVYWTIDNKRYGVERVRTYGSISKSTTMSQL